jgi:ubiquinone biosynthesis protein UbiJ
LAISIMAGHRKKSLQEAFSQWFRQVGLSKSGQSLSQLRSNVDLIEQLKRRIAQLEGENDQISNENEELRQFSLDGFELAKNVQALTGEREKLSVDLADKA